MSEGSPVINKTPMVYSLNSDDSDFYVYVPPSTSESFQEKYNQTLCSMVKAKEDSKSTCEGWSRTQHPPRPWWSPNGGTKQTTTHRISWTCWWRALWRGSRYYGLQSATKKKLRSSAEGWPGTYMQQPMRPIDNRDSQKCKKKKKNNNKKQKQNNSAI